MRRHLSLSAALSALALGCASGGGPEPEPGARVDPGARPETAVAADGPAIFTATQAERGAQVYDDVCLECHTRVEFTENAFLFGWEGASVARLLSYMMENMPDDAPGSLSERSYLDVTAYILAQNGWEPGSVELESDMEALREISFESRGASAP